VTRQTIDYFKNNDRQTPCATPYTFVFKINSIFEIGYKLLFHPVCHIYYYVILYIRAQVVVQQLYYSIRTLTYTPDNIITLLLFVLHCRPPILVADKLLYIYIIYTHTIYIHYICIIILFTI